MHITVASDHNLVLAGCPHAVDELEARLFRVRGGDASLHHILADLRQLLDGDPAGLCKGLASLAVHKQAARCTSKRRGETMDQTS